MSRNDGMSPQQANRHHHQHAEVHVRDPWDNETWLCRNMKRAPGGAAVPFGQRAAATCAACATCAAGLDPACLRCEQEGGHPGVGHVHQE